MVNKLKQFFRSLGGKSSARTPASPDNSVPNDRRPTRSGSHGSSSVLLFRPQVHPGKVGSRSSPKSSYDLEFDALSGSPAPSESASASPAKSNSSRADKWSLGLVQIPKLVADATAASQCFGSSEPLGNDGGDVRVSAASIARLLELRDVLGPMVGDRELRRKICVFYFGQLSAPSGSSRATTPAVGSEPRRVLRCCRHALLSCWKLLLMQLVDKHARHRLSSEHQELCFDLITLIAESAEFSLTSSSSSHALEKADGGCSTSPLDSAALVALAVTGPSLSFSTNALLMSIETAADGLDDQRALLQYRCLLVATFKLAAESLDAARHRQRERIPIAESRFFAKVFAICYVRVPPVQAMLHQDVSRAYANKRWANCSARDAKTRLRGSTTSRLKPTGKKRPSNARALQENRCQCRVEASSQLWSGATFADTLRRWGGFQVCEFGEGEARSDSDAENNKGNLNCGSSCSSSAGSGDDSTKSPSDAPSSPTKAETASGSPTRQQLEVFKLRNPTLFRWTQFAPYLGSYTDVAAVSLSSSQRSSLRRQLTLDGEFFAIFMGFLSWHVDASATLLNDSEGDAGILWDATPGYDLLARTSMLLVKEACWAKWECIRDRSWPPPPPSVAPASPPSPRSSAADGEDGADANASLFALPSLRAVRTVLDNVGQLLRNREMLDSCVLAMYESTNALHPRSVDVCLTRFEQWLQAAAASPAPLVTTGSCEVSASTRPSRQLHVPAAFNAQVFGAGVSVLLASDNCEVLNRALLFLYNCMELFDGELRRYVLQALVQRHMDLFLHWNADVRRHYHHLLVFKLGRVPRDRLESPIDRLLVGKLATDRPCVAVDPDAGFDVSDSTSCAIPPSPSPMPRLSRRSTRVSSRGRSVKTEESHLRLEQALWRAFDACTAVVCVHERRRAREAHLRHQHELEAVRRRAVALHKLNRSKSDGSDQEGATSPSNANESLPGAPVAAWEVGRLGRELRREPPYYLRYLPVGDLAALDELKTLARAVYYPVERQVYAAPSLRGYTDLLAAYYRELHALVESSGGSREGLIVSAPPLGYY